MHCSWGGGRRVRTLNQDCPLNCLSTYALSSARHAWCVHGHDVWGCGMGSDRRRLGRGPGPGGVRGCEGRDRAAAVAPRPHAWRQSPLMRMRACAHASMQSGAARRGPAHLQEQQLLGGDRARGAGGQRAACDNRRRQRQCGRAARAGAQCPQPPGVGWGRLRRSGARLQGRRLLRGRGAWRLARRDAALALPPGAAGPAAAVVCGQHAGRAVDRARRGTNGPRLPGITHCNDAVGGLRRGTGPQGQPAVLSIASVPSDTQVDWMDAIDRTILNN